jgi:hypothetical protein
MMQSMLAPIEAAGETRRDRKRLVPPRDCWHPDPADELAGDFAGTTSHRVGPPADCSRESLAGQRKAIEPLARQPNVVAKISRLAIRRRRWTAEQQQPVAHIANFGAKRA